MGQLTTHVLDTANGMPAAGVDVRLYALSAKRELCTATRTNNDGRTDAPLLADDSMASGEYEIEFDIGEYFRSHDYELANPGFLNTVVIRFTINADERYHVPLLASPWSYSTYRGS